MSRERQNPEDDPNPVEVDEEDGTGSDTGEDSVSVYKISCKCISGC